MESRAIRDRTEKVGVLDERPEARNSGESLNWSLKTKPRGLPISPQTDNGGKKIMARKNKRVGTGKEDRGNEKDSGEKG